MSDLRTAAQQALKALAGYRRHIGDTQPCDAEIALLDALAQQAEPVQKPVAWLQPKTVDAQARPDLGYETCSKDDYGAFPVYPALAQEQVEPVQEPVAWIDALKDAFFEGFTSVATYNDTLLNSPEEAWENYKPPRAAPPQRKPLTEEEIRRICDAHWSLRQLVRAVERAHGIGEQS